MGNGLTILVRGMGPLASSLARHLLLAGYGVVLHQTIPPMVLYRQDSFADAWFDGVSTLNGVEARRTDQGGEFLRGLQSRMFIPVLRLPLAEVTEKWPWDVVIDARTDPEARPQPLRDMAELTIGVGGGLEAGLHVDMVIESRGSLVGTVVRQGKSKGIGREPISPYSDGWQVRAGRSGMFLADVGLGTMVLAGDVIGWSGSMPVASPMDGVVAGLLRDNLPVAAGTAVADIIRPDVGPSRRVMAQRQTIARAVTQVIEMERSGQSYMPSDMGI